MSTFDSPGRDGALPMIISSSPWNTKSLVKRFLPDDVVRHVVPNLVHELGTQEKPLLFLLRVYEGAAFDAPYLVVRVNASYHVREEVEPHVIASLLEQFDGGVASFTGDDAEPHTDDAFAVVHGNAIELVQSEATIHLRLVSASCRVEFTRILTPHRRFTVLHGVAIPVVQAFEVRVCNQFCSTTI